MGPPPPVPWMGVCPPSRRRRRPVRRRSAPGCASATRSPPSTASGPVTSSVGPGSTDEPDPVLDVVRGGLELSVTAVKAAGEPLGVEVHSALFDQLRTCDNHCEFCFIYQLPPGLRSSLYLKDDDYRLSFLYGNFTTLTRFTEADLERVVTERLSPLNVSIHATDPDVRSRDAAQPPRRHQPAVAAGAARPRHRGPRPGRVLPGRQRRRRARRHPGRGARPVPRAGQPVRRAARGQPVQHRGPHAGPHAGRGGGGHRRRRGLAGRLPRRARPPAGLRRRRVLPARRSPVPAAGRLRGLRHARGRRRHGRAPSSPSFRDPVPAGQAAPSGARPGFFAWADGTYEAYRGPRSCASRRGPRGRPRDHRGRPPTVPPGTDRHPHRRLRRPGPGAAGRRAGARRRAGGGRRQPLLRRQPPR